MLTQTTTAIRSVRRLVAPAVLFAVVVTAWYVVRWQGLSPGQRFLLPAPHAVMTDGFFDADSRSQLLRATLVTARVAVTGLAIAVVLGMGAAIAMSEARWVRRSLYPYTVALQTVPVLAITPLIGFWLGYSFRSRVVVCVIVALFPIVANTLFGLDSTPKGLRDLFRMAGAGRLTRLRKLRLMAGMPAILTGVRIAAGWSVVGAVVSDFFFGQGEPGIGRLLDLYRSQLQGEQLFAAVLLASALGLTFFVAVNALTQRLLGAWHESAQVDA